jgi:hypothetical protein
MAQAHADPTHAGPRLHAPAVEESIRPEIQAEGVPPPETVEQARQTTSLWAFVGVALVIAGLLLAVFTL